MLEEYQVERERQQVERIRRDEAIKIAEELEKKRVAEERMEELKKSCKEVEERLSQIEEEYRALQKMKRQLDMEMHEMEKERSSGVGEEGLVGDPWYPSHITHTEQQTDDVGCNLDQILLENQSLKKN